MDYYESNAEVKESKVSSNVFNGPHTINGVGTYKFLHKHLNWPEPN